MEVRILALGCLLMAAAGWWCQMVRYPAFRRWSDEEFRRRHTWHTFQISLIVIPGMLMQLGGTVALFGLSYPPSVRGIHLALCCLSLGPTFLISGPIHGRLAKERDHHLIEKLIKTNLPRTVAWTAQLFVAGMTLSW